MNIVVYSILMVTTLFLIAFSLYKMFNPYERPTTSEELVSNILTSIIISVYSDSKEPFEMPFDSQPTVPQSVFNQVTRDTIKQMIKEINNLAILSKIDTKDVCFPNITNILELAMRSYVLFLQYIKNNDSIVGSSIYIKTASSFLIVVDYLMRRIGYLRLQRVNSTAPNTSSLIQDVVMKDGAVSSIKVDSNSYRDLCERVNNINITDPYPEFVYNIFRRLKPSVQHLLTNNTYTENITPDQFGILLICSYLKEGGGTPDASFTSRLFSPRIGDNCPKITLSP